VRRAGRVGGIRPGAAALTNVGAHLLTGARLPRLARRRHSLFTLWLVRREQIVERDAECAGSPIRFQLAMAGSRFSKVVVAGTSRVGTGH
jgi:hypothetical protein